MRANPKGFASLAPKKRENSLSTSVVGGGGGSSSDVAGRWMREGARHVAVMIEEEGRVHDEGTRAGETKA